MEKISALLFSVLAMTSMNVLAIDKPDAPDRTGEFEARMSVYVDRVHNASATVDIITAYYEYEQVLDEELNNAYSLLMSRLDDDARQKLRESQRQWIAYRDTEFAFIRENWTRANFGSSYAISRGGYRTSFIRERIVQLLRYSANYL